MPGLRIAEVCTSLTHGFGSRPEEACSHRQAHIKICLCRASRVVGIRMSAFDRASLPLDTAVGALRAAGEETRLRVLVLLAEGELSVSDLTDILGQSQPRISRHLKLMAEAGLIERNREGSW